MTDQDKRVGVQSELEWKMLANFCAAPEVIKHFDESWTLNWKNEDVFDLEN